MPVQLARPLALAATLALVSGASHVAVAEGQSNAAPAPQATAGPAGDVFDGELEVQYEDYVGGARLLHFLNVSGRRLKLEFPGDPPELMTGQRVRARGRVENNTLQLSSSSDLQAMTLAAPNTFGEQKVVVLLVNFADWNAQPYTAASAAATTFQTVSDFYRENSYQQTWLTGNVYGWYTLPVNSTSCDYNQIATLADQAATNAGVNLAQYTRRIYAFPGIGACSWWGLGTVGGNPSRAWINGSYALKVVAHELGHNYGDHHSHSLPCDSTGCSMVEYGDDRDMMGGSATGHFTAFQKERLGWLNYGATPPVTSVTQSGSYFLEAYATNSPNPKAIKILKEVASGLRTWYYVEARVPVGFDAGVTPGVLVHTGSEVSGSSSNQVDLDQSTPTTDTTLEPGQTFTDPIAGVTISTAWAESTGALVNVLIAGPPCSAMAPTLTISPATVLWAAPASPVNYSVTVRNNDSSTCDAANFALSATVPAGWSGAFASPSVSVAPGASATVALTVTSAAGANGQYTFQAQAERSAASGSVSQTLNIVSAMNVGLSVTRAGNGYQFTATVLAGSTPVTGASVSFTVTNPQGLQRVLSATTGSGGVAKVKYSVTRNDPAGTYVVSAVASKNGLSGTAAGAFVK